MHAKATREEACLLATDDDPKHLTRFDLFLLPYFLVARVPGFSISIHASRIPTPRPHHREGLGQAAAGGGSGSKEALKREPQFSHEHFAKEHL